MAYDVVCIGNAIVDLISGVGEDFVANNGLDKGGMMLVDAAESARRRSLVSDVAMAPGGSAANTAACLASLGSRVAFVGKVGNDALGAFFRDGMREIGVDFLCEVDHEEVATANCLALVTPDGERTMSTFLGACTHLSVADIPEKAIAEAKLVFIEGYLLDSPHSAAAVEEIFDIAISGGTTIAITLSDSRCVERNRTVFDRLTGHWECGVVIANEKEIRALHEAENTSDALEKAGMFQALTVVTLGSKGATSVKGDPTGRKPTETEKVAAEPVDEIVDLVGAGDAFAAGFLHGYVDGEYTRDALAIGAKCASVVIQGQGARPSVKLSDAVYGKVNKELAYA
ncbi:adenosine kinase [Rhizobium sp. BK176]|uniref:adenosine kinase n=1 Tax=Rhizobium sp. BK176 TaxID=2587071 RepID=UPI00216768DF|nr:adenosine kinase [Rhizobium sp. BK176]MCS4088895.1 sugar/nucleoside kinase (ribokinase family) [Rhizobium sp. BK176]